MSGSASSRVPSSGCQVAPPLMLRYTCDPTKLPYVAYIVASSCGSKARDVTQPLRGSDTLHCVCASASSARRETSTWPLWLPAATRLLSRGATAMALITPPSGNAVLAFVHEAAASFVR